MEPTAPHPAPNNEVAVPWRRLLYWELCFQSAYLLRFSALEIWRAAKTNEAVFEELKFGETPLATVRRILGHLPPLGPDNLIYDLGCGRGRAAFFFHFLSDAHVIGVDLIPSFITTGCWLARKTDSESQVDFVYQDIREGALTGADVVYACALCFGATTRDRVLKKVLELDRPCHLVTVGWRPQHPRLEETAHFSAAFSWGRCGVSIQRLHPNGPELTDDPSLTVDP